MSRSARADRRTFYGFRAVLRRHRAAETKFPPTPRPTFRVASSAAAVPAVCLLVASAGPARSQQAADVVGTVVSDTGSPMAGVEVTLLRSPDAGTTLFELFGVGATLFTACLEKGRCEGVLGTVRTGRDGRYAVRVPAETMRRLEDEPRVTVTARLPAGRGDLRGAVSESTFRVRKARTEVPALRVWRAVPAVSQPTPMALRVEAAPMQVPFPRDTGYAATFYSAADRPLLTLPTASGTVEADARLLEGDVKSVGLAAAAATGRPTTRAWWR
jgi:hypothetical protein